MTRAVIVEVQTSEVYRDRQGEGMYYIYFKILKKGRKRLRWWPCWARDALDAYMRGTEYLRGRGYKL